MPEPIAPEAPPVGSESTILIVDDDLEVTVLLREFLESRGYVVRVADTGAEGLRLVQDAPVALVLLDLQLPDVEGTALIKALRRRPAPPEVVIVTGHATLDSAIAAIEAGAAGYVRKPCDLVLLSSQIAQLLERRRLGRETARRQGQLTTRVAEAEVLLEIARTVSSTLDMREGLRRICRELARLAGADTVSVHLLDRDSELLQPYAAYRIPKEYLSELARIALPLREQGFHVPLWTDRRPVHSDDVGTDDRFNHEAFRRFPHQSGLLLPLVLEGEVAGAFYLVWWTARRRFADAELGQLERVAEQVAVFLRNARLYERAERGRRRLEVLSDVSRRLAEVHDTDQILARIVDEASRLVEAEAVALRLLEGGEFVLRASTAAAAPLSARRRVGAAESLAGLILAKNAPVTIEDLGAEPGDGLHTRGAHELGFRGFLGAPLRARGRIIGTLNVYTRTPRRFTPDEVALVSAFADQASWAIEQGRLLREADERRQDAERGRRQAEVIASLVRDISASLDLGLILQRVAEGARELCGSDRAMVALRDPTSDAVIVRHRAGSSSAAYVNRRIEPGCGVGGQVLVTGRPFRTDNYEADPRITKDYLRWARDEASVASVAVPIQMGGRIEGLLYAQNTSPRPFGAADEAVLSQLADHAAIAIANAQLFAREQAARAEAEAAAEALRASEERYRAVVDGSLQGMYIHQDRVIRFANEAMVRIFGYTSADELVGQDCLVVFMPEERARVEGYRAARLRGEPAPTRYETRGRRRDGTPIWIELLVSIVAWEGRPAVLAAFLDISERKRAEHALRRTEEQNVRLLQEAERQRLHLEQIFASTSDGILVLDADGRIAALNRRGGELLGVRADEAVGRSFRRLVGDLAEAGAREVSGTGAFAGLAAGGGDLELQVPSRRTLHWNAAPMRAASGADVGVTITFQDVTQDREVSRMKSDFVSFVTHQLRTPLAGIKWMLELAVKGTELPEEARSNVEDARAANERLIGLVNDLLDISRLEGGRLSLVLQQLSLEDVTRSVVEELAPLVRERGHQLSVESLGAVPVVADPQLLRQVILNLVSNAIKYTPPGGRIEIRTQGGDAEVHWTVADSGIGIPAGAHSRLFEKFYRAENAVTLETEGTGLGLYLVRLIVERFGGRIWCESDEGQGSRFTFALPAHKPRADHDG